MPDLDRRLLIQGAAAVTLIAAQPAAAATDSAVHVIAEIVAKPDKADEARTMLVAFVYGARKEPGGKSYALLEMLTEPGHFFTSEVWTDKVAIDAHMGTPEIKALGPKLTPLLAKPFTVAMNKALSV